MVGAVTLAPMAVAVPVITGQQRPDGVQEISSDPEPVSMRATPAVA